MVITHSLAEPNITPPPLLGASKNILSSSRHSASFNFKFSKSLYILGKKHCGKSNIFPSQSSTTVSNSVHDGLAAHEKFTVPKPAESNSPIIDG